MQLTQRRYGALTRLASALLQAPPDEWMKQSLEGLANATPASVVQYFHGKAGLTLAAEVIPERQLNIDVWRAPVAAFVRQSLNKCCTTLVGELSGLATQGQAETRGIIAVPVKSPSNAGAIGAIGILLPVGAEATPATIQFVEAVAQLASIELEQSSNNAAAISDESQESTRMASLGLLTATVAHELRGPAGALILQQEEFRRIIARIEILCDPNDTALSNAVAELEELASDIKIASERIRDTVEQLGTVSRRETETTAVDIANVVRESLAVIGPHLERRQVLLHRRTELGCFTLGRRDSLSQVVLNLVFNAIDACENGPHPEVWVKVFAQDDQVLLLVEDNGPGVPPDNIENIFRPFFTTKRRGTGLGLKICSDVVNAHGGHIEVHERPGGGASFRVVLPKARDDSGIVQLAKSAPSVEPSSGVAVRRILVVDDDPIFARTLRRTLRPHEVRTASSASEADVLLADSNYLPDLVLCDLLLPGSNGDLLHQRLLNSRPEVAGRFVFVTGGALGKSEAEYLRNSGQRTLFKPIELRTILELLEASQDNLPDNAVRTLAPPPAVPITQAAVKRGA